MAQTEKGGVRGEHGTAVTGCGNAGEGHGIAGTKHAGSETS